MKRQIVPKFRTSIKNCVLGKFGAFTRQMKQILLSGGIVVYFTVFKKQVRKRDGKFTFMCLKH